MKKLLILPILLLSACATKPTGLATPVKVPDLPPSLSVRPKPLPMLTDPSFGAIIQDSNNTDIAYNEVTWQLNNILDFYGCVQKVLNENGDPKVCLNK